MTCRKTTATVLASMVLLGFLACPACLAAEGQAPAKADSTATPRAERSPLATGMIAMGAALSVGLCALATGLAQSRIGAAGCGTLAEKPEATGTVILLVAIPETMVILGFVVAVVLMFAL